MCQNEKRSKGERDSGNAWAYYFIVATYKTGEQIKPTKRTYTSKLNYYLQLGDLASAKGLLKKMEELGRALACALTQHLHSYKQEESLLRTQSSTITSLSTIFGKVLKREWYLHCRFLWALFNLPCKKMSMNKIDLDRRSYETMFALFSKTSSDPESRSLFSFW